MIFRLAFSLIVGLPASPHNRSSVSPNDYYNTAIVRLCLGRPIAGGEEVIPYLMGGYQNWRPEVGGHNNLGAFYHGGLVGTGLKFDVTAGLMLVVSASA